MKVYFKNSKGNEILIGEAEDDNRAFKIIEKFCHERNFMIQEHGPTRTITIERFMT